VVEAEAQTMIVRHSPGSRRLTLGADKAYDVRDFVDNLRDLNVTPHIAQNTSNRISAIDARTTRHPGYAISQQKRKLTGEPMGGDHWWSLEHAFQQIGNICSLRVFLGLTHDRHGSRVGERCGRPNIAMTANFGHTSV
jgi:hypothetical protein